MKRSNAIAVIDQKWQKNQNYHPTVSIAIAVMIFIRVVLDVTVPDVTTRTILEKWI